MILTVRLLLSLILAVTSYEVASRLLPRASLAGEWYIVLLILSILAGIAVGYVVGGFVGRATKRLGNYLDRLTVKASASQVIFTIVGLVFGLGIAALASLAVKDLPIVGAYLLPLLYAISAYIFAYVGYKRHADIARLVGLTRLLQRPGNQDLIRPKLLDTSVLIDGRIGDVVPTGFAEGDLIIPAFVLEELQSIADSADSTRRARGRRGLEVVRHLQDTTSRVIIMEKDYAGLAEVDAKLIKLARELKARILTTDFNLNQLAQIQGLEVLNINELANALKPVVLPGESLGVRILREGKEEDQGVGYLDDGTMVVIEGGRSRLGEEVEVEVTSVLQNPSGKMIFTRLAS